MSATWRVPRGHNKSSPFIFKKKFSISTHLVQDNHVVHFAVPLRAGRRRAARKARLKDVHFGEGGVGLAASAHVLFPQRGRFFVPLVPALRVTRRLEMRREPAGVVHDAFLSEVVLQLLPAPVGNVRRAYFGQRGVFLNDCFFVHHRVVRVQT